MHLTQTYNPFKNITYIIVSIQDWKSPAYNIAKLIAKEVSQQFSVLFINPGLGRGSDKRPLNDRFEEVNDKICLFTPNTQAPNKRYLNVMFFFKQLNRYKNIAFAREILFAINERNIGNFVLLNINDLFRSYYLKELTAPLLSVYYISHSHDVDHHWYASGKRLNKKLIKKADVIFSANQHLTDIAQKHNNNTFHLGLSFDTVSFSNEDTVIIPNDVRDVGQPIAGYIGVLSSKYIDLKLMESVANKLPEWNFILIDLSQKPESLKNLRSCKNIHILHDKPLSLIPSYIKSFTVAINPQTHNGNAQFVSNCISMGKACVSTPVKDCNDVEQHFYRATDADGFIKAMEIASSAETSTNMHRRVSHAKSNSWRKKTELMLKVINDQMNSKNYFNQLKKA